MFLLPQPLVKVSRLSLPTDVSLPVILLLAKADIPTLVSGYFNMFDSLVHQTCIMSLAF